MARVWLLAAVLLATGCGSAAGYKEAEEALEADYRPRLTKAELVTAANAVCTNRKRALDRLPRPRREADKREFFARVATIQRDEAQALSAFRAPVALERDYALLLAASSNLAEVARRFQTAVVKDDARERRVAMANADQASEAYDLAARRLGLACRQSV